jgi:hypothetical protein
MAGCAPTLLMRVRNPDPNAQCYKRRHSGKTDHQSERNFAEFSNFWRGESPRADTNTGAFASRRAKRRLLAFPSMV